MKTVIVALVTALLAPLSCGPSAAPKPPTAEVWAFCGVHPNDPKAQRKANTMAQVAGVDATMGPCLLPDWNTYTPAFPGQRYLDPEGYFRLTVINANAGMKTVVYDARIWSDNPDIRQQAINFWQPHAKWIQAWDMGDEFDPASPDWDILVKRWYIVLRNITPVIGGLPYTNNLGGIDIAKKAIADMPSQGSLYSFDIYAEDANGYMMYAYDLAVALREDTHDIMCAVNALKHNHFSPTPAKLEKQMKHLRTAGCTKYLIFGGDMPIDTDGFSTPSLVYPNGSATPLARAVAKGAA